MTKPHPHPLPHAAHGRAHLSTPGKHSRREFLRRSALLAGAGVAAPWAVELAGVGSASVDAVDTTGYKALVCVFMYGGNDHYDTMVPYDDASHRAYAAVRGSLTRPRSTLLALDPAGGFNDGRAVAFAPEWAGLKGLFDSGRVALVSNVGTLLERIDKAGFDNRLKRPPQLFSHNDQQSIWQSSAPEGATTGWGGRLGDLLLDGNGDRQAFTCISSAGNAVLLSGRDAVQFHVSDRGVVTLESRFRSAAAAEGLQAIMGRTGQSDLFAQSYSSLVNRALSTSELLEAAVSDAGDVATVFPQTRLGGQLKTVAQLINAGRNQLGLKRQVFFVAAGGFDNHSDLNEKHSGLLTELDGALTAFHSATEELGTADEVTSFTASDFGRTLTSNGDGTDHGWGAHHIVMGDAVAGNRAYGTLPVVAVDGPDDVGQGRLIPTTAVDQYAATLASWMGASGSELDAVVPNLSSFDRRDLGFMKSSTDVSTPGPGPGGTDGGGNGGSPTGVRGGASGIAPAVRLSG